MIGRNSGLRLVQCLCVLAGSATLAQAQTGLPTPQVIESGRVNASAVSPTPPAAPESTAPDTAAPADPAPPPPAPPAGADLLDLFGQDAATDRRSLPESQRILRRPESPASATSPVAKVSEESRVIDRRPQGSVGWRVRDLLPLASVLGLIAVVAFIIKRFMPARGLIGHAPGLLEVVARTPVSPRQNLLLVRVGRRFLLLGVSADRMTTLAVVDDPESTAELMGEVASRRPDSSTSAFQQSFRLEEARFEDDIEPAADAGGHVRGLLEKIRQMKRSRVA